MKLPWWPTGSALPRSRLLQLPAPGRNPQHLRGRAFARFDVLWQCGRLLSLLLGGLPADTLGIRAVYYIGALLLLAAAAGWAGLRNTTAAEATWPP